jgi:hypothetical protein
MEKDIKCITCEFNTNDQCTVGTFYEQNIVCYEGEYHSSNLIILAKPNYTSKSGEIKRGLEMNGKYYAPKNDLN